ncbi:S-adenosyl-L-methionine-dependent methyltransferase [Ramaria rubella]|nr:S-adenosyl-L-methionine-dependent methyltransferase [Ramaria rubella]
MGKNKRPGSLLSGLPATVLNAIRNAAPTVETNLTGTKRATDPETPSHSRPAKKQKLEGLLGPGWEKYDATNVVPFYRKQKDVPEMLRKYFYQRERYFSLYDQGCLLDEEGWYSVTPEGIADVIAEKCRCDTVLDAFCGVGGNAIAFARTCERVIAMDTSETRLRLARHNAIIYGVQDRIEFILGDYVSFANTYVSLPERSRTAIDVVFLSPPWGGMDYTLSPQKQQPRKEGDVDGDTLPEDPSYSLERIRPLHGADLFHLTRRITPHIAYYLPRHTNLQQVSELRPLLPKEKLLENSSLEQCVDANEVIEVQEAWMGNKLKAITCYFGGLVEGQDMPPS